MTTTQQVTTTELCPGDVLEPGFTVANVAVPERPAVVATITSTAGNVRYAGVEAVHTVRRPDTGDCDHEAHDDHAGATGGRTVRAAHGYLGDEAAGTVQVLCADCGTVLDAIAPTGSANTVERRRILADAIARLDAAGIRRPALRSYTMDELEALELEGEVPA